MKEQLGKIKDFSRIHKKISIIVTILVVAVAGVIITLFLIQKNKNSQNTVSYREYSAAKSDVTVGISESGTVALDDETVAFPVQCTVSSVLVKSGQKVKKGDALIKLDLTSVSDSSADTRQKLEAAKISLQSALNDQKAKLESAKITYESSKYLVSTASTTKQLTLAELQNNVTSAQTSLANDQKDLATYQALQKSWPADYAKLQQLKKWMNDAQSNETSYNTQLTKFKEDNNTVISAYDKLKDATETAKEDYIVAKNSDDETDANGNDIDVCKSEYENAQETQNEYYNDVAGTIITQETNLEDKVAQYTAEYNNYSTAYNNFKETYDDKYKITGSELDTKVSTLQNSIKTDQYNLSKAQKTAQISSVDADTKEKTDLNTAANADDAYNLTVNQLQEAAATAQDSYDKLQRQMDEINNALNGNGTITAPCDGFVAEITTKAGSSVEANTTMLEISKTDSVSVSLSVSEDDIPNVAIGQDATISLSSQDDEELDAMVESITAEPARSGSSSVTYTVVVKTKSGAGNTGTVYDGMSADATVIQKRAKNVVNVNDKAITFNNGVSTVLVKNQDGSTSTRTVQTGFSNGTSVEITSGLEKGETVLAESSVKSK